MFQASFPQITSVLPPKIPKGVRVDIISIISTQNDRLYELFPFSDIQQIELKFRRNEGSIYAFRK